MTNQACIRALNSFFLLFLVFAGRAQNNLKYPAEFYSYLKQQELFTEQIAYLDNLQISCNEPNSLDTIHLSKAQSFYSLEDTGSCRKEIDLINDPLSFISDGQRNRYVASLFILKKLPELQKLSVTPYKKNFFDPRAEIYFQMLNREKLTGATDSLVLNDYPIKNTVYKYKHFRKRSPIVAGLLSSLVPGLGKLYVGYKYQAFSAFTTSAFMAAQTVEAYLRSGVKSVHFGYTCSLFGVYYLGNIAGSVWSAKKKKHDHFNQVDHEIVSYYSSLLLAQSK